MRYLGCGRLVSHPPECVSAGRSRDVAALFVAKDGAYWDLPHVDPWDQTRDARRYGGPHPVVAHPPCSAWCRIAYVVEARWGHPVGEDGGCFESALASVRQWGGVLEHPAFSLAWQEFGLPVPVFGRWTRHLFDPGWTTEVHQVAYGHRARKATWLYYVGKAEPPALDWSSPAPTATVSYLTNHGDSGLPRLSKREAKATPHAFRDVLLELARMSSAGTCLLARRDAQLAGIRQRQRVRKYGQGAEHGEACVTGSSAEMHRPGR